MQLVLFEGELVHRGRKTSKCFVDEISESDVGEIRLIMGGIISFLSYSILNYPYLVIRYENKR